jgi:hypothetical protein
LIIFPVERDGLIVFLAYSDGDGWAFLKDLGNSLLLFFRRIHYYYKEERVE